MIAVLYGIGGRSAATGSPGRTDRRPPPRRAERQAAVVDRARAAALRRVERERPPAGAASAASGCRSRGRTCRRAGPRGRRRRARAGPAGAARPRCRRRGRSGRASRPPRRCRRRCPAGAPSWAPITIRWAPSLRSARKPWNAPRDSTSKKPSMTRVGMSLALPRIPRSRHHESSVGWASSSSPDPIRPCEDQQARGRVADEAVGPLEQRRRPDQQQDAGAREQVVDPAGNEEVAVELVGARLEHRGLHARELQVERVVDRDRARREAVDRELAVRPRLRGMPSRGPRRRRPGCAGRARRSCRRCRRCRGSGRAAGCTRGRDRGCRCRGRRG